MSGRNSGRAGAVALTALAPMAWGSTYFVTTQYLPEGTPILDSVLRALPAGLLLLLLTRTLPQGAWWWRSAVLGVLNIGAFFPLLFVAAYLLPGGVAATVGAVQPLLVAALATRLADETISARKVIAGAGGVAGVALLVLQSTARLDLVGVLAALGGAASMATGVVLTKRWGGTSAPLAGTAWQLVWGGAALVPLLLLVEGVPAQLTVPNLAGFAFLSIVGGALAYALWFRGIAVLPVGSASFLGLLSPVVAVLIGWVALGQQLSWGQLLGAVVILAALAAVFTGDRRRPVVPRPAHRPARVPPPRDAPATSLHRATHPPLSAIPLAPCWPDADRDRDGGMGLLARALFRA